MELPPWGNARWTERNAQEFLAGKYAGDEGSLIRQAQQIVCELGRGLIDTAELANMADPVCMAEKIRALENGLEELRAEIRDMRSSLRSL